MKKIRLSPSKIEKYRQYNEGEYSDFITKESVIESIIGESKWTAKAEFGTAFHAVMRYGAKKYRTEEFFITVANSTPDMVDDMDNVLMGLDNDNDVIEYSPSVALPGEEDRIYRVQDEDMPHALELRYQDIRLADEYHDANPGLVWEIPLQFVWILDGEFEIMISLRMDAMIGIRVKEHKTSNRPDNDYNFYQRSCQWRIYLIGTGAERCTYERFYVIERVAGREIRPETFHFFPDDEIKRYVEKNMRGIIQFCANNVDKNGDSLMKYITR